MSKEVTDTTSAIEYMADLTKKAAERDALKEALEDLLEQIDRHRTHTPDVLRTAEAREALKQAQE